MNNEAVPDSERESADQTLAGLSSQPLEASVLDDLLSEEEEYALGESYLEPPRISLPKPLVWGFLILLVLAAIVLAVWGFTQSTWTYATMPVGAATSARLAQLREKLAAAGAPETLLRQMDMVSRPDTYNGDAVEVLLEVDKALEAMEPNASIASARRELHAIVGDLNSNRWPLLPSYTPPANATPKPTLALSAP